MEPLNVFLPAFDVIASPVVLALAGVVLMAVGLFDRDNGLMAVVGIGMIVLAAFASPAAVGGLFLLAGGAGLAAYGLGSINWQPIRHAAKRARCRHFGHSMGDQLLPVGFQGSPDASCVTCGVSRSTLIRAARRAARPPIPRIVLDRTQTAGVVLDRPPLVDAQGAPIASERP